MSTILKSLKKLEEEKSVLEKSIDLESLVIQNEQTEGSPPAAQQIFVVTAFAGVGLVLGGLWVAGGFESKPAPVRPTAVIAPAVFPTQQKHIVSPGPVYAGVPLASIPSASKSGVDAKPSVPKRTAKKPKRMKAALPLQEAPQSTVKEPKQLRAAPPLQEIQPLQEAPPKGVGSRQPEPQSIVRGNLPGFTLRGIIHFDEDSPYNYIFYSTAQEKNKKLRAGEKVFGATLKKIEPDSAIFAHRGKLIQIPIGQRALAGTP